MAAYNGEHTMITLPTRDDGGIDWGKLEAATTIMISSAAMRVLGEQIAAYERERCAKWHDDEVKARSLSLDEEAVHKESAAALRKMED